MNIVCLTVGLYETNCYIVADDMGEGIVVDPGAEPDIIITELKRLKARINYIVLTHGHADHAGALAEIRAATGARVAIHPADMALLADRQFASWVGVPLPEMAAPEVKLDGWQTLTAGKLNFTILYTPGHSPGGICLLIEDKLFSGDTLFADSIGRDDLPGGNQPTLIESIQTKLMILPDDTVVYPGHGPATTIGHERRHNPFLQGEERPRLCPEHPGKPAT